MSVAARAFAAALALAAIAGCAAKRLPPGTPPPEYETRTLEPWFGDTPDAGTAPAPVEPPPLPTADSAATPAPSDQPKTEPAPLDAGMGPSPDAGVR